MLSMCRYAIVMVEGYNDAYLLGAIISASYSFHYDKSLRRVNEKLWECMHEEQACTIAYIAEGVRNLEKTVKRIHLISKTIPSTEHPTCLAVIVDSNAEEPATRAERYYQAIATQEAGARPVKHEDKYFASICTIQPKGPILCTASWRCSAECWISLTAPGSPITSIEDCNTNTRRQCHETARRILENSNDKVEAIRSLIENTAQPWKTILDSLAKAIQDGEQK